MKNKKNIYILVPAVILIWGVIGYKIVKTIHPEELMQTEETAAHVFIPQKIEVVEPYKMREAYRDPFLGTMVQKKTKPLKRKAKPPKKEIVFPSVEYQGIIAPKESKESPVFLIKINNQQNLVRLKGKNQGVTLLAGNEEEIVLEFEKQRRSFAIQK